MNGNDEDFAELRRLLALKAHEVPPPGYFQHFADQVVSRIEELEVVRAQPWWRGLLEGLDFRPLLAGAYAAALCGAMLWASFAVAPGGASDRGTMRLGALGLPEAIVALEDHGAFVAGTRDAVQVASTMEPVWVGMGDGAVQWIGYRR